MSFLKKLFLVLIFGFVLISDDINAEMQEFSLKAHRVRKPPKPQQVPLAAKPFIRGVLHNQLGNQMFEIAATINLALDNQATATFPDLVENPNWKMQENYKYVFWRLNVTKPNLPTEFDYAYHDTLYQPIPYRPNMTLTGIFQSEKFFSNHKKEIIDLFSPNETIVKSLYKKYPWLKKHPKVVGVHVRAYYPYYPGGWPDGKDVLPFLGFDYFTKAINSFPIDSLFVVFSDNIPLCRQGLSHLPQKIIFIEGQTHYNDLFMMSLCKHNIISNSSFSWWGAYLNKNPNKIVIGPKNWFTPQSGLDSRDILPDNWITLE